MLYTYIHVLRFPEESNTPITKISVSTHESIKNKKIAWTEQPREKARTNDFNEVRQLACILGTEGI